MLIELRRHAHHINGELAPKGIAHAIVVGREQMRGKGYTHFAISHQPRTSGTLQAFAEGASDFPLIRQCHELDALDTKRMGAWRAYFAKYDQNLVPENELVREEAARMTLEFLHELGHLGLNVHLLGVGHSPFIECLVYGLTSTVIAPLEECHGVILSSTASGLIVTSEFRL
ncbi:MAG: hypothetical protein WC766_05870 [Patescibacteria group bacterium]|jgi:hypothetical protein